ncbi:hypothetical protein NDU88_005595 [Pleurodeles waltl]|uniref:Uncharacterized protein n=1 Tax=Pleurodeles waltl TaxID=8319 RepID=A0AAV7LPI9_PLEWA|nr:hypothetical protein NDU88_005595 [Pleurodeles waltl]
MENVARNVGGARRGRHQLRVARGMPYAIQCFSPPPSASSPPSSPPFTVRFPGCTGDTAESRVKEERTKRTKWTNGRVTVAAGSPLSRGAGGDW